MNRSLTTLLGLALAATLAGCIGQDRKVPEAPQAVTHSATEVSARPTLDDAKIKQFGFQLYWDSNLRDEEITSLTLEGDALYAFTRSKRLYQIDVHSGMVNWVYDVGRPLSFADRGPIAEWIYVPEVEGGPKQYDEIFFIAQDHLYAVDKKNGAEIFTVYLPFTPSSPPAASATHVFVGSWDDRIYAIRKDNPTIPDWFWNTGGDVLARAVYDRPSVFVPSSDGNLYTFDAAQGEMKWPFKTERQLKQDPLLYRSLLYLPSDDYNLYVLGVDDGLLNYRFCAGAPITTHPVAIDKTIYFAAGDQGMYALLRKDRPQGSTRTAHQLLWQRKGAEKILCKGNQDVYLLETGATASHAVITRLNAKDGHFRDSLEMSGVDYWLTDAFDPNDVVHKDLAQMGGIIFLGFRNGWIMALKETATIPGA